MIFRDFRAFSLSLTHCIPRVGEVVRKFFERELFRDGADIFLEIVPISWLVPHREVLELGEHLLDRIVHDDDVAAAERRDQLRFDVDPEGISVDRAAQDPRSVDPVLPQSGHECGGYPIAEGSRSVLRRHAGLHPRHVDEDLHARTRAALKPLLPLARVAFACPIDTVRQASPEAPPR